MEERKQIEKKGYERGRIDRFFGLELSFFSAKVHILYYMRFPFSTISNKELERFDALGLIPGPKEEDHAFIKRIEALEHFFSFPPDDITDFVTDGDWQEPQNKTRTIFGFSTDWIVAHYSDAKLPFFQGAATWICEKNGVRIPLIQLKKKLENGRLFRIYNRDEVLAHEAVHAARMQFDEPWFEEIFAYRTSSRFFLRCLGPIFQAPWETYLFLGLLFVPLSIEIIRTFFFESKLFFYLSALPAVFFVYSLIRLCIFRGILGLFFRRCIPFFQDPNKKWAVALRLTDTEICQFAFRSKKWIEAYFKKEKSLRWHLLKDKYFKK